jgi:hypothetical protein
VLLLAAAIVAIAVVVLVIVGPFHHLVVVQDPTPLLHREADLYESLGSFFPSRRYCLRPLWLFESIRQALLNISTNSSISFISVSVDIAWSVFLPAPGMVPPSAPWEPGEKRDVSEAARWREQSTSTTWSQKRNTKSSA